MVVGLDGPHVVELQGSRHAVLIGAGGGVVVSRRPSSSSSWYQPTETKLLWVLFQD